MATEFSFSFSDEFLKLGIKEMDRKLNRAAYGVCRYWDSRIEAHMKHNAPWKDRTTNARNGLFANAAKFTGRVFGIILGHSVTYGIYLEKGTHNEDGSVRMKARPIIIPTLNTYGPKVMTTFKKLLDRL